MKRLNIIWALLAAMLLFTACDDYLDKLPDDRATLDSESKITQFITSAYGTRNNAMVHEYSSDNMVYNGDTYNTAVNQEEVWKFEDVTTQGNDDPRSLWNNYYAAVAAANAALDAIDEMGNPASLYAQRAEALLCRAWGMFRLATLFCMAYDPTKDYMGLPYPKASGLEIVERGTLTELYDNINADIEEALPNVSDEHLKVPKYHFNRKAAYAFAARFNLYYLKFDKAIKYATQAIGEDPSNVLRNWAEYEDLGSAEIGNAYVNSSNPANLMLHAAHSLIGRMLYSSSYRRYGYGPVSRNYETFYPNAPWGSGSKSTTSLIMSSKQYGSAPNYRLPKIVEFWEYTDVTAGTGYAHIVDAVFTTDETLLVRAEAYALLKQYDNCIRDLNYWIGSHCRKNNYFPVLTKESIISFMEELPEAPRVPETDLNRSIRKALHPQGFTIESGDQTCILQFVSHVRRLETIVQGLRFCDIKRYGIEYSHEVPNADPIEFVAGDLRGAIQIPADVLEAGMVPNPREVKSAPKEE